LCVILSDKPPVAVGTSLEAAAAAAAVGQWTAQAVSGVCAFNDETAIAVLAGMREHDLAAPRGPCRHRGR
jgi:DNA-binding LacI/PurR family transcriptional regulator